MTATKKLTAAQQAYFHNLFIRSNTVRFCSFQSNFKGAGLSMAARRIVAMCAAGLVSVEIEAGGDAVITKL